MRLIAALLAALFLLMAPAAAQFGQAGETETATDQADTQAGVDELIRLLEDDTTRAPCPVDRRRRRVLQDLHRLHVRHVQVGDRVRRVGLVRGAERERVRGVLDDVLHLRGREPWVGLQHLGHDAGDCLLRTVAERIEVGVESGILQPLRRRGGRRLRLDPPQIAAQNPPYPAV